MMEQLTAAPQSCPDTVHASGDIADLAAIFDSNKQMVVWQRSLPDALGDYLKALDLAKLSGWRGLLPPGMAPDLATWPSGAGLVALRDDLALLSEILAELMGADRIGTRIEVLSRPMCPNYHIDQVGLRLICTYAGKGTEWREGGCHGQLAEGEVALIKGRCWPDNKGAGLQHRSPQTMAGSRLLVAMDAIFEY